LERHGVLTMPSDGRSPATSLSQAIMGQALRIISANDPLNRC